MKLSVTHQFEVHRLNLSVFYPKYADCAFTFDMNHDLSYEAPAEIHPPFSDQQISRDRLSV